MFKSRIFSCEYPYVHLSCNILTAAFNLYTELHILCFVSFGYIQYVLVWNFTIKLLKYVIWKHWLYMMRNGSTAVKYSCLAICPDAVVQNTSSKFFHFLLCLILGLAIGITYDVFLSSWLWSQSWVVHFHWTISFKPETWTNCKTFYHYSCFFTFYTTFPFHL